MHNSKRLVRTCASAAGLVALLMALLSPRAEAQSTTPVATATGDSLFACYVPNSGTVYRIRTADTPSACVKSTHVPFGWPAHNGLRRMRQREHTFVNSKSGRYTLYCAGNERAISGGYVIASWPPLSTFMVRANRPDPYAQGWEFGFESQYAVTVQMYTLCAPI